MTIKKMDNVLIVVDDLEATKAFFASLGMTVVGETTVEGPWADRVVGLKDVRADIAMMRRRTATVRSSSPSSTSLPRSGSARERAFEHLGHAPHHVPRRRP